MKHYGNLPWNLSVPPGTVCVYGMNLKLEVAVENVTDGLSKLNLCQVEWCTRDRVREWKVNVCVCVRMREMTQWMVTCHSKWITRPATSTLKSTTATTATSALLYFILHYIPIFNVAIFFQSCWSLIIDSRRTTCELVSNPCNVLCQQASCVCWDECV